MKRIYDTWQETFEAHRSALIEAIKAAYRSQCTTSPTSGITERVVLWDDGDIRTMTSVCGNTFYAAEREGKALCVAVIGGERPDNWEEWLEECGTQKAAQDAMLEYALIDWGFDPEQYIDDTLDELDKDDAYHRQEASRCASDADWEAAMAALVADAKRRGEATPD